MCPRHRGYEKFHCGRGEASGDPERLDQVGTRQEIVGSPFAAIRIAAIIVIDQDLSASTL
jgi:hypothetical protein